MEIGYACLTVGVIDTQYKTCIIKNVNDEKLAELISHNLYSLENMIDYNIKNNIKLFRITSDLIPFGSNPVNNINWEDIFRDRFKIIADKIKKNKMRVSMHPGQYTVLNSNKEDVVERAIVDLKYHAKVLKCLEVGQEGKIILHIGGVYNDKKSAISRFTDNYRALDKLIKKHLVIENDDRSYTIEDVLEISKQIDVPVVFDNLHHNINSYDDKKRETYWIDKCRETWKKEDGNQKIHYSQQDSLKRVGSHSSTIESQEFLEFFKNLERLKRDDIDIMLEVKDKNLSAVKCKNLITENKDIKKLELEWSRYKYKILENHHKSYLEIRSLLKDKCEYPTLEFYNIIENTLKRQDNKGSQMNAAMHIWGYFKNKVTDKEKISFMKLLKKFEDDAANIKSIKNSLLKLALKYNEKYIINSLYFYI